MLSECRFRLQVSFFIQGEIIPAGGVKETGKLVRFFRQDSICPCGIKGHAPISGDNGGPVRFFFEVCPGPAEIEFVFADCPERLRQGSNSKENQNKSDRKSTRLKSTH